jgi:hypothetical protein
MFKILAVICTLGGDCFPYITEDRAAYKTLDKCDQEAQEVSIKLSESMEHFPELALVKVGCVPHDYKLD